MLNRDFIHCVAKDNVNVHIDSVLYWHVVNPSQATFGVSDVKSALIERYASTSQLSLCWIYKTTTSFLFLTLIVYFLLYFFSIKQNPDDTSSHSWYACSPRVDREP